MQELSKKDSGTPRHIAIIMDGNGRWAKQRGLPRAAGHKEGAMRVANVLTWAKKYGVKYLTLYAFSTENWKRPPEEVDALMALLKEFLLSKTEDLMREDVRLKIAGRLIDLSLELQNLILDSIEKTANNQSGTLVIALNYGGRSEIVDATKKIAELIKSNKLKLDDINETSFADYLYNPDVPDPELLIRTSGELRISNFLLWEISYSEFFVTDKLWPDFDEETFAEAIDDYKRRNRRQGGL